MTLEQLYELYAPKRGYPSYRVLRLDSSAIIRADDYVEGEKDDFCIAGPALVGGSPDSFYDGGAKYGGRPMRLFRVCIMR